MSLDIQYGQMIMVNSPTQPQNFGKPRKSTKHSPVKELCWNFITFENVLKNFVEELCP